MKKLSFLPMAFLAIFCITACTEKSFDSPDEQFTSKSGKMNSSVSHDSLHADVDGGYQAQANEYLQRIHYAFSSTPGRERNGIADYPGYFGGAFINEQGKLVVLIKGDAANEKQAIIKIIGSDDFITIPCKQSYKTLVKIMSDLNEFKLNKANASKSSNFNAFALMDNLNQVTVELDEFNDKRIQEFKKNVMNSSAIVFQKSSGRIIEDGALKAGCPAETDKALCSYAFRAKRNSDGAEGIVTTGHSISVGGELYEGAATIGTCTISQNSGSVDAAFVPIYDPVTYYPSNLICNTADALSTQTSQPGVGTIVNMRGRAAVAGSSGKILSTNATITNEAGITMTNMTSADYISSSGDSGGIVYTVVSSTNTRYTVGVNKGHDATGKAYFTKAHLALSALGVSRY